MNDQIKHHIIGGVYAKEALIQKGGYVVKHKHNFSHMSIMVSGHASVIVSGMATEYTGFNVIEIEANQSHSIIALEDTIWLCVHATDETDPAKVDHELIRHE